jgi:hypothetical protein
MQRVLGIMGMALGIIGCTSDGSSSDNAAVDELAMRVDQLEATIAMQQSGLTTLEAANADLVQRMPTSLGSIGLRCTSESSCTKELISVGTDLEYKSGAVQFTISPQPERTVLVTGSAKLVLTGSTVPGHCVYTLLRIVDGITYGLSDASFTVPANEELKITLSVAAHYFDGAASGSPSLVRLQGVSVEGSATCSVLLDSATAWFSAMSFGTSPLP